MILKYHTVMYGCDLWDLIMIFFLSFFCFFLIVDGTGFAQIYLQCSPSVAVDRNKTREHHVAKETIVNMASNLEVPDAVKALWETYTAVVDAEKQWNDDDM